MIERTTVRLPADLLDRARRRAADEGRTLTALIEDGVRLVVAQGVTARRDRGPIPVSKATGGVVGDLGPEDATPQRAMEELEDINYARRLKRA